MKIFDTIAAIATPIGVGGIAIIRISGESAEALAESIVFPKCGRTISRIESHKLVLSDIKTIDDKRLIDEALVSVMRAPNSYTGETVVEINCHGGYMVAEAVLEEIFKAGARQAEAGEFTRRAFMNGKTDLLKAEATIDLIHANSELGRLNAVKTLSGGLSEKVEKIREEAIDLASNLSAILDYPDEIEEMSAGELESALENISNGIEGLLRGFKKGKIMRDGIKTVIAGRPNVGKSSLLNALSRTERAIVADIPGTTRDTVEEYVTVKGIALRLIDTAGIRESDNSVERIGVQRAKENIKEAQLCLFVLDASEGILDEDLKIFEYIKDKPSIIILNKTDKNDTVDIKAYSDALGVKPESLVMTATPKDGEVKGIDVLEDKVIDLFMAGGIDKDDVFISNDRQKDALLKAMKALGNMKDAINLRMPTDMLYVDLEDLIQALGEVTGATVQEEIIEKVFERFCVGK